MMKRASFAVALMVSVGATDPSFSQDSTVRLAHPYSSNSPVAGEVERFAALVNERLGDAIDLSINPDGPIAFADVLPSLQSGATDISLLTPSQLAIEHPNFDVFNLPFAFSNSDEMADFQRSEAAQSLLSDLGEIGLAGLGYWPGNARVIISNQDFDDSAGLQGLRVRATPVTAPFLAALGADVQQIPFSEVHNALQTGAVDAAEVPLGAIPALKLQDYAKTVIVPGHKYDSYVLAANDDFWSSLPDDVQEGLVQIAGQVAEEGLGRLAEENQTILANLSEQGVSVVAPSEDTLAQWRSAAEPLWSDAVDTDLLEAAATGGGGDPCPLGTCKCTNRECRANCCQ